MESKLVVFQGKQIRRVEVSGEWFFSVVDIVGTLFHEITHHFVAGT
jgi:hypothetical protein